MAKWILIASVAALILGGPVHAQEPGGEEEEFDVRAALKKVAELMRETERHLVDSLTGRPAEGAAESGEQTRKAIEKLLRESEASGQAAAEKLQEIVDKAPARKGGGSGEGQESQKPDSEEERRRREEEAKAKQRDPKNSAEGEDKPKDGKESESEPTGETAEPPPSEIDEPSMPDPDEDWLGRLPDKLRQVVKNREYDKIPPKFRKLFERYFKRMAEVESDR